MCLNLPKIRKSNKNLMTSSVMPFNEKRKYRRKLKIGQNANDQSKIVKWGLNDVFKLKKGVFVKNYGAHFTLQISTNQIFGTYAFINRVCFSYLHPNILSCEE